MEWATEVATSQAVWAILCIVLTAMVIKELRKDRRDTIEEMRDDRKDLISLYEDSRAESKAREQQLMEHLERSNESQEQTTVTLTTMSNTLGALEGRMDRIEKMAYKNTREGKDA